MKVFFIARGIPSELEPQWGCFEYDQAVALKKLGHEVVILSVDVRYRNYHRKYGISKSISKGIPHYSLFYGSVFGKVLRLVSMSLSVKAKRHLFKRVFEVVTKCEGTPDLIYAHYLTNISMALYAKQKYGIPIVGIEHWSELGYGKIKPQWKQWASAVYQELDLLLTVSSALQKNIKKNIGVDSIVVNNMVGGEFFYAPKERVPDMVRFISTGNLLPVKGFDNLINAFSNLGLPPNTWVLNIVGGGKEHDYLQQLIDTFELGENIRLCGRKDREGVIDLLQNSDVYVMSSRSETFGVAAIEALACGLPVIATDCGGARDFLNKGNGLLCPVNDIHKLADALFTMYKYHGDYNRAKIAEDCQKHFSSEAIGKQLEKIFEEVISKSKQQ